MLRALSQVVVVLVRSEGPLNVGSVARLCGNFGCSLRLVQPLTDVTVRDAVKMAHPSEALLAAAPLYSSLAEALHDVALAVATSSKLQLVVDMPALSVTRAKLLLPSPGEKLALVFGNERTGLSKDEGAACQRVIRLPTPGPTESLNLSHAVAVALTLLAEANVDEGHTDFRATTSSRQALLTAVLDRLEARGFFKGKAANRLAFAPRAQELADKMDVSERDVQLLHELLAALAGPVS